MSLTIVMTTARLDDPDSLATFLAAIPNGDRLADVLGRRVPVASRAYDDDAETARFVASDGMTVKCFAVSEITIDQAEMIAYVDVELLELDEAAFRDLAEHALGPNLDPPSVPGGVTVS